jgi:FlaG/FlaF family flagellin (archaellin)
VANVAYTAVCNADVALAAATKEGIIGVRSGSTFGLVLVEFSISFDGITPTNEPVTVSVDEWDGATAGTSTAVTPVQLRGQDITHGLTCARDFTAQPTVLVTIKEYLVHPQTGIVVQFPLGREPESLESQGWLISGTAPAVVNARGYQEVERT